MLYSIFYILNDKQNKLYNNQFLMKNNITDHENSQINREKYR
jgi:hypothetical protein